MKLKVCFTIKWDLVFFCASLIYCISELQYKHQQLLLNHLHIRSVFFEILLIVSFSWMLIVKAIVFFFHADKSTKIELNEAKKEREFYFLWQVVAAE